MASTMGPVATSRATLVTARPVSHPSEVATSKARYRWMFTTSDAPGRYEMVLWGSTVKRQKDRLVRNPNR